MTLYKDRLHCYNCYRPKVGCICHSVEALPTQSCFVILMHEKEFRKTKNGTGRMTHLTLPNSHLFIGIDFSHHKRFNALLNNPLYKPFLLYPSDDAINLSQTSLMLEDGVKPLFILIDSTWACSKKMLRLSRNLHALPTVSFETTTPSKFSIKEQPNVNCLSTIETSHKILQLLNNHGVENLHNSEIDTVLNPFYAMIDYQVDASKVSNIRYKPQNQENMTRF